MTQGIWSFLEILPLFKTVSQPLAFSTRRVSDYNCDASHNKFLKKWAWRSPLGENKQTQHCPAFSKGWSSSNKTNEAPLPAPFHSLLILSWGSSRGVWKGRSCDLCLQHSCPKSIIRTKRRGWYLIWIYIKGKLIRSKGSGAEKL